MSAAYYFIPWVRSGLARLIRTPELGKASPPNGAIRRVSIPVTVSLNGVVLKEDPTKEGSAKEGPAQLYGPYDIAGIDVREIIRTAPLHLTPDYAPEKFAFMEFDRPDFPWMFTPGAPDDKGRLRPWIVLVVVEKRKSTITPPTGTRLPILSCPVSELPPNLDECWAWAHAQYAGDIGDLVPAEAMGSVLSNNDLQNRNLSRLLCPRKLEENTAYVACLVPAFEVGRKALLDMPFNPDVEPAHWNFAKDEEVKLPLYYQWEFSTGHKDPFQELAERLKPLDPEVDNAPVGIVRDMDLSDPGNGMGTYEGKPKVRIPSALQIKGVTIKAGEPPQKFISKLRDVLLVPPKPSHEDTRIPPPVYGSWHAPPGDIALELKNNQGWISNLNLDPGYRVAAALGTQIVQQEQEHLVAAAWEQVKDLQAVNDSLRHKQLGCCVVDTIHGNRLTKLSTAAFAQVCSPIDPFLVATARTRAVQAAGPRTTDSSPGVGTTVSAGTVEEALEDPKNSPQFRRMTRGGGSWAIKGSIGPYTPDQIAPPPGATEGAKQVSGYKPAPTNGQRTSADSAKALDAKTAVNFKDNLLKALKPQNTFGRELKHRLSLPATVPRTKDGAQHDSDEGEYQQLNPPYGPVTYAPSFPHPMYGPLRDQFLDMLLPGLDKIPNDRATLLVPDAKFIEAYLVGLNHELSREFLWREFPTLLHTTYFRQFWDTRGAERPEQRDIPKIREWMTSLGQNLAQDRGGGLTFLLIRSELIVRYPNALIYARKKASDGEVDARADSEFPVLRFSPIAGVALLGFNIPDLTGWKFFVEEHFTEPYMGPDKTLSPNAYVPFASNMNSAEVAKNILMKRYFRNIRVTKAD